MKNKTLIYTSIYDNLFGTEFGGRCSRLEQYKYGLLSILNLQPDLLVCFTQEELISDLEIFFFCEYAISREMIKFIPFNLKDTIHFEKIKKLKNIVEIQTSTRCFEIQYNKFLWLDLIDTESFDKVYWFDAGLSHIGLFPENYSQGSSREEKNYERKTLFNKNFLEYLNQKTNDNLLLVAINNRIIFKWGENISQKYYNEFDDEKHIIGGFFGGSRSDILSIRKKFEELLIELLDNEEKLYFEETIMCCLYYNNKDTINLLDFEYWNYFDTYETPGKYFYELFLI
jgi:hypothetical protein